MERKNIYVLSSDLRKWKEKTSICCFQTLENGKKKHPCVVFGLKKMKKHPCAVFRLK
jgi:hypothetical protein